MDGTCWTFLGHCVAGFDGTFDGTKHIGLDGTLDGTKLGSMALCMAQNIWALDVDSHFAQFKNVFSGN